jgi:hypothetical protein
LPRSRVASDATLLQIRRGCRKESPARRKQTRRRRSGAAGQCLGMVAGLVGRPKPIRALGRDSCKPPAAVLRYGNRRPEAERRMSTRRSRPMRPGRPYPSRSWGSPRAVSIYPPTNERRCAFQSRIKYSVPRASDLGISQDQSSRWQNPSLHSVGNIVIMSTVDLLAGGICQ